MMLPEQSQKLGKDTYSGSFGNHPTVTFLCVSLADLSHDEHGSSSLTSIFLPHKSILVSNSKQQQVGYPTFSLSSSACEYW